MTAREYCINNPSIACASTLGGVEIKGFDYTTPDTHVYAVSGALCSQKSYHHVKIHFPWGKRAYFVIGAQRVYLDECIRM